MSISRERVIAYFMQDGRRFNYAQNIFGIVFVLDRLLTLDNENKLSLFSPNRNFALPLQEIITL